MKSICALIFLATTSTAFAESLEYIQCTGAGLNFYQDGDTAPQTVLPFDLASYPDTDKKGVGSLGCVETLSIDTKDHSCDLNVFSGLVDSKMMKLRLQIGVNAQGSAPAWEELVISALFQSSYKKHCNSVEDCYGYLYQGTAKIYDDSENPKLLKSIPVKCEWTFVPSDMAG